ncbi:CreA family protein [Enterovibrio sp. NIFS-20-8]|nr:CreA family protein [Enterovibrio paralichthyis]MBV7297202.1 CreA family protein [Enterovibrio paralichthyis]
MLTNRFKSHKNTLRAAVAASVMGLVLAGCSDKDEVGDVSLGLFTTKDIKIQIFNDPEVPGVTCHISHVKADLDFSDPSDMGISCRQTGEITEEMIEQVDKSKSGEVIFTASKSILFKSMKIRRIFDSENQTLMYLSYSTKETQGSHKHSLSTVPLWGTKAWQSPETAKQ